MDTLWKIASGSLNFLLRNSLLLLAGAGAALVWANLNHESYAAFVGTLHHVDSSGPAPSLHFIVNDVLMCFFFAMAAKEIWEALLPGGALASLKVAATPLLATFAGVAGPAVMYLVGTRLLEQGSLTQGWAIPCATDIAFSYMVARLLFGPKHPAIPFLLLLAIVDDALGLMILAVFYSTGDANLGMFLLLLAAAIGFNLILRRRNVQNFWMYLVVAGPLAWWAFYEGGVHTALALVPLIPTIPHQSRDEGLFVELEPSEHGKHTDPLNRFAAFWKNPVEFVLGAFGFVNAGVLLSNMGAATGLVAGSLVLGKPLGITLMTWFAIKALRLEMPRGLSFSAIPVLGCIAGIGFTVALFVSTVAFPPGAILDAAKMGALASFASAVLALLVARVARVEKAPVLHADGGE